jgi:galactokinase
MNEALAANLAAHFKSVNGVAPRLFFAPGRVNIIGEHTDYNDGYVLPAALDLATYVAAAPRDDRRLLLHARASAQSAEFDLDEAHPTRRGDWSDYARGVVTMLQRAGVSVGGATLLIDGDLPMGSGLSSSASFEVAIALALTHLVGVDMDRSELARLCQRAENDFVGMRCGIMDQLIVCRAQKGAALLLDCRTLEARAIPIDPAVRLIVCDSGVRHTLAGSEYNLRRRDCETAVALLARVLPGLKALRDLSLDQLATHAHVLPPTVFRRARHVVSENWRTLFAAAALESGRLEECGRMIDASHDSLRDDYEVSCAELDRLVDAARDLPGVYGARMMGGGFGGCTINLVAAEQAESFMAAMGEACADEDGAPPAMFCCSPGPCASEIHL